MQLINFFKGKEAGKEARQGREFERKLRSWFLSRKEPQEKSLKKKRENESL